MFITLNNTKQHLNIDESYRADDDYILSLIQNAEDAVAKRLNVKHLSQLVNPNTGGLPDSVLQAILLLVGNWYQNREPIAIGNTVKIPYTLDFIFDLNKNYNSPF